MKKKIERLREQADKTAIANKHMMSWNSVKLLFGTESRIGWCVWCHTQVTLRTTSRVVPEISGQGIRIECVHIATAPKEENGEVPCD